MKRTAWVLPLALSIAVLAVLTVSCGTEEPGTNGPSEQLFPVALGDVWTYDTFNLTNDPERQHPIYTHVSIENLSSAPGVVEPVLVTKYGKRDDDIGFRLGQAHFWLGKDIFYKYDYYTYDSSGNDFYYLRGYFYTNEFRDPVLGTYFTDGFGAKKPLALFKMPLQTGYEWDCFNTAGSYNSPTWFTNVNQKDWFGLRRDLDGDGQVDSMDISLVGRVNETMELVPTERLGDLQCYRVDLTQHIIFHTTQSGDIDDISTTSYWIAHNYGIVKVRWYDGSGYLDNVEMTLRNAWYVK